MKTATLVLILLFISNKLIAQQTFIPTPENIIAEGISELPANLINDVKNYTEARGAALAAWHPLTNEMLITTRFANSNQLHVVKMPGGDRKQLTFFEEPINIANFEPVRGNYILFLKDKGGDEFNQIYRYDLITNKTTLLTNGKQSQNGGLRWNNKGDKIAYSSTRRNGQDRDIYLLNPLDSSSNKQLTVNKGGDWAVVDWSADDSNLLLQEGISYNETRLYIINSNTGIKTRLLPEKDERTTYDGIAFSKDGNGIYLRTNKDNEFNRLAYYDLIEKKISYLSTGIAWDVEKAALSYDGSQLFFVTNENGLSKIYLLETRTNKYNQLFGIPAGIIGTAGWTRDSKLIGFTLATYKSLSDVFVYNLATNEFKRWTDSELGGLDASSLQEPQLISWKSFDERPMSGYLYKAHSKFTGKRPVIINIHGGPESQSRPIFQGRSNYYLNELGISIIYPNVRGSTGYGKSFIDLDNGIKRENSVKDIGALIDWIAQQPELDKNKIMVMGGSYGGYMTLAVSYMYSEKIRCSLDVVGISNFNTFLKNTEAYRRDLRRVEYGDERDPRIAAYFDSIAPLNHSDKIKKPILIVQGRNDPRVPYTESIQMKEKIKQNGGIAWFLMAKDEGHGFKKKNNIDFQFYATIVFIKQFLMN